MTSGEFQPKVRMTPEIGLDIDKAMRESDAQRAEALAASLEQPAQTSAAIKTLSAESLQDPRTNLQKWGVRFGIGAAAFGLLWGASQIFTIVTEEHAPVDPQENCVPIEDSALYGGNDYSERSGANSMDETLAGLQGPICNDAATNIPVSHNND